MSRSILRSAVVVFVLAGILSAAPAEAQTFSTPWMHATNEDWAIRMGHTRSSDFVPPRILGSAERGDGKLGWSAQ